MASGTDLVSFGTTVLYTHDRLLRDTALISIEYVVERSMKLCCLLPLTRT